MTQNITNNIAIPNNDLGILKANFPHCFDKNGGFDFEKFKKELQSKEVDFSRESYGMDWLGKSYARLLASDPALTLLKEDKNWNERPENKNSENLLIKGDNLEVLKHLSNAYHEKVKMIYIDPPYNTGSDGFVYADDRKFTVEEFQKLSGVDADQAKKILSFVNSKSNSHSAWLTFMYPRLYIAKQLLRDDGVIFISIDDNEVAQLRILMDEVFGEENVEILIWNKEAEGSSGTLKQTSTTRRIHEYIICAFKNHQNIEYNKVKESLKGKENEFQTANLVVNSVNESINHQNYFTITNPDGVTFTRQWKWNEEKINELLKNDLIFWGSDGQKQPRLIIPTDGRRTTYLVSILNYGGTTFGRKDFEILMGEDVGFSYPKPVILISKLIETSTNNNDIILDFFAGSGTTGDAVMQLNAEDRVNGKEGNRKYILVQLPEAIDPKKNKTAYDFVKDELKAEPTIFEITKERLVRAGKKIQLEQKLVEDKKASQLELEEKIEKTVGQDFGFKIFETMPIWEDYEFETDEFDLQATLFDESKLTPEDIQTLLTTWKTFDNISLTVELQKIDLGGYTGHYWDKKLYLMDKGFQTENLKQLLEELDSNKDFSPASIIVFGYHFDSKNLREISENVSSYANKKKLDIDFITRY